MTTSWRLLGFFPYHTPAFVQAQLAKRNTDDALNRAAESLRHETVYAGVKMQLQYDQPRKEIANRFGKGPDGHKTNLYSRETVLE